MTSQSGNSSSNSRLAVDGNHAADFSLGSCSLTTLSEIPWWRVDLGADVKVTGVFIQNRGDAGYRAETELSIRVGYLISRGGIGNPPCGGLSHSFPRGMARMVRCTPEVPGIHVTIFSLEVNSTLSLCEVEVEISEAGKFLSLLKYKTTFIRQICPIQISEIILVIYSKNLWLDGKGCHNFNIIYLTYHAQVFNESV